MNTKTCNKCEKKKALELFKKNKKCKYGVTKTCIECTNNYKRSWRNDRKETENERVKIYRLKNPEKTKISDKKTKIKRVNQNKICSKIYYSKNKDIILKRKNKERTNLDDSYVKQKLKRNVFIGEQITPELIELKRIIIKTTRLCHQLKN